MARLNCRLHAVELGRPLEDAVRHLLQALLRARAAEQDVHLVVVGLHVLVGDRPVHVEAVAARGPELQRPVAQRAPAPEVRPAPEHPRAHPGVGRARGRVLLLVHHPVAGEGVAGVRGDLLVLREAPGRRRTDDREVYSATSMARSPGGRRPRAQRGVRPLHRPVLLALVDHPPRLQHQHLEAGGRELEGGHASRGAAADDDHVVALAARA